MKRITLHALCIIMISCIPTHTLTISIYTAIDNSDVKKVKELLQTKKRKVLHQQNSLGYTPLHLAVKEGETNIARLLIESGANVNQATQLVPPDTLAEAEDIYEKLEEVIDKKSIPRRKQRAWKERISPKERKPMTPLQVATSIGYTDISKLLLENGADPNIAEGNTHPPLHIAVTHNNMSLVQLLVNNGANINTTARGKTPLYIACDRGNADIAVWLLKHNADPNIANKEGSYPLHVAMDKRPQLIQTLMRHNANPEVTNEDKETPLHDAARLQNTNIVEMLINNGAQPNVQDNDGQTPLIETALAGNVESARILLNNGANPNVQAHHIQTDIYSGQKSSMIQLKGGTALHIAAAQKNTRFVYLLLQHGVNTELKTQDGTTALDLAPKTSAGDIIQALKG